MHEYDQHSLPRSLVDAFGTVCSFGFPSTFPVKSWLSSTALPAKGEEENAPLRQKMEKARGDVDVDIKVASGGTLSALQSCRSRLVTALWAG